MIETTLDHARKRVIAFIDEIERLKHSDFPYQHSIDALVLLEKLFQEQLKILKKVHPQSHSQSIHNACCVSRHLLYTYLPFLGFILRSTNVRNAFEAYAPLLRLARKTLKLEMKLIISSEWNFSPFTYASITHLPDFVLIGLPAPESANPLLIPLAGHELGHSVWKNEGAESTFEKQIEDTILNEILHNRWNEYSQLYPMVKKSSTDLKEGIFARTTWVSIYKCAQLQAEEMFCDFFGIRLFAESYLHAFSYLVSPGSLKPRSVAYPNIKRRALHLVEAARVMEVQIPKEFESNFMDEDEPKEPTAKFIVSIADQASSACLKNLISNAITLADSRRVPFRDSAKVSQICNEFGNHSVPCSKQQSLVDILNAGWMCSLDPDFGNARKQIPKQDVERILKDLMLKSMEVSEICERLGRPT